MKNSKQGRVAFTGALSKLALGVGLLILASSAVPTRAAEVAAHAAPFKSEKEKQSYAIGMVLAGQLQKQAIQVDPEIFMLGLGDAFAGGKTLLSEDESRATLAHLKSGLKNQQNDARETARKEGEAFLANNRNQEGVMTLASGLQYKVLKAGDGKKPTINDTVVCNYRGTLLDGKEFDNSYKRNQPATFAVSKVIKGWSEALQLMPAGSTWQLFVPSGLGYGERGAGRNIGPDATLVFEVELISIVDAPAPRAELGNDSFSAAVADGTPANAGPRRKKNKRAAQSPLARPLQASSLPSASADPLPTLPK